MNGTVTQSAVCLQITVYDIDLANATIFSEKVREASAGPPWNMSSPTAVSLIKSKSYFILAIANQFGVI